VAETECLISQTTLTHASQNRPMTALTTKDLGVADHLPKLLSCIEQGDAYPEDKFQAQVCVGWLHWVVGEYNLAALRLPANLEEDYAALNATGKLSEWTNVCALKAAYLKANCFARNNERGEALAVFESGLQAVRSVWAGGAPRKQLRYWAELFLTEYCMLSSQALNRHEKSLEETNSLACFRSWARYWETQSGSLAGGHGFRGSVPRRRIWNEYYIALSRIVETDLPFPTGYLGKIPTDHSARSQLRMELKRIETAYESLLLRETEFPRADEEREEVEDFIKLVLKNWVVMCGRGWREHDLGPGGRESMGRGVLELLYRASTKTYHSTQILRGLFQLHLAVADFDLAFKAFDSYMELIKKGKARVGKTGSPEPSLDNDGIVLQTMAQCLLARCRYGDRAATEKAWELAGELEDWLARLPQLQSSTSEAGSTQSPVATLTEILEESPLHPKVRPNILGLVWQAIGLAHASWSRLMYDAALRSEIQTKAVRCLRKSLSAEFGRSRDIRGIFALGLLLAERRELTPAIEMVKMALMSGRSKDAESELQHGPYWQERALIPLWHLLALLLSARQEFFLAARACEGAFEQFKDPAVLFGHEDPSYRSDHLNEAEKRDGPRYSQGVVDEMDDLEKETILEVKMTQLALIELNEGPDVAVNASYELLTLFSRLFGSVQAKPAFSPAPPATSKPPKSSAATLRSIKGSIFGRRSSRSVGPASREVSNVSEMTAGTTQSRPHTTQTTASTAPAIQITQENGHTLDKRSSRKMSSEMRRRSESGRRHSLRKRDSSSGSRKRATSSGPTSHKPTIVDGESFFTPEGEGTTDPFTFASKRQPSIASSFSRGRSLPHLDSYLSTKTRASEYSDVSTDATYTIASCLPIVQFSKEDERRQRSVILVRVWLMIAGFYRRAEMFDDCKGAIAEAQKIVGQLESDDARDSGSLVERSDVWGVKRSVEDLMGDVWTEVGYYPALLEELMRKPILTMMLVGMLGSWQRPTLRCSRRLRSCPRPLPKSPLRHRRPLPHPS